MCQRLDNEGKLPVSWPRALVKLLLAVRLKEIINLTPPGWQCAHADFFACAAGRNTPMQNQTVAPAFPNAFLALMFN